jgi:hypothetical protein
MPDETKSGTNWTLGLDRLLAPSFDLLGIRLRDKLRHFLSSKTRERVLLRQVKQEYLVRQIELRDFGADYFFRIIENGEQLLVEQHLDLVRPTIEFAIREGKISPNRALECLASGLTFKEAPPDNFERILHTASGSVTNLILGFHVTKIFFHFSHFAAAAYAQTPTLTDEQLDELLEDPKTLDALSDSVTVSDSDVAVRFGKLVADIFGIPWESVAPKPE